jgi:uncharacterized RmlC-like cupin family protein
MTEEMSPVPAKGAGSEESGFRRIAKPDAELKVIRPDEARVEQYRVILPRQDGAGWRMAEVPAPEGRVELVSMEQCGARGIHLSVVTLQPGTQDHPHWHVSGEKVMYVVSGRGRILAGEGLTQSFDLAPGDCVFVPPYAVHAPASGPDEPLTFVMVTNAPLDVTVPG